LGDKNIGYSGIYLNQNLIFIHPVYINETVVISIELTKINNIKSIMTFKTSCSVNEKIVVNGTAEIYVGKYSY
jgi:3-hydroxybutyryl-CoA dehydratase